MNTLDNSLRQDVLADTNRQNRQGQSISEMAQLPYSLQFLQSRDIETLRKASDLAAVGLRGWFEGLPGYSVHSEGLVSGASMTP